MIMSSSTASSVRLVFARPSGNQLPDVGAVAPDKDRSRLRPAMPWIGGKQSVEITVVSLGWLKGVERLFSLVMAAQSVAELMQRIDALPRSEQWPFAGDFVHQLVDIFKFFERRPAGMPCPPVRTRPQPHRKGLGEVLVRMALRIPKPKMLDITPAGWIGAIVERVGFGGQAEQLLPARQRRCNW